MKQFLLKRIEDETGVSGTGIVAEGVQFFNGKCTLTWITEFSSVAVYDSIDLVEKIHGHNGKTVIVWVDEIKSETEMEKVVAYFKTFILDAPNE